MLEIIAFLLNISLPQLEGTVRKYFYFSRYFFEFFDAQSHSTNSQSTLLKDCAARRLVQAISIQCSDIKRYRSSVMYCEQAKVENEEKTNRLHFYNGKNIRTGTISRKVRFIIWLFVAIVFDFPSNKSTRSLKKIERCFMGTVLCLKRSGTFMIRRFENVTSCHHFTILIVASIRHHFKQTLKRKMSVATAMIEAEFSRTLLLNVHQ